MTTRVTRLGDITSDFLALPGVQTAYNQIQEWWTEWTTIPARLSAAIDKAAELNNAARAQGKPDAAGVAADALSGLADLRSFYQSADEKLQGLRADLKSIGLGFVPLIVAAVIVAAAGAMYYVFKKTEYYESVLHDVEAGVLTSNQGTAIVSGGAGDGSTGGGGGGFGDELGKAAGDIAKAAAVGIAGYALFKIWQARQRKTA